MIALLHNSLMFLFKMGETYEKIRQRVPSSKSFSLLLFIVYFVLAAGPSTREWVSRFSSLPLSFFLSVFSFFLYNHVVTQVWCPGWGRDARQRLGACWHCAWLAPSRGTPSQCALRGMGEFTSLVPTYLVYSLCIFTFLASFTYSQFRLSDLVAVPYVLYLFSLFHLIYLVFLFIFSPPAPLYPFFSIFLSHGFYFTVYRRKQCSVDCTYIFIWFLNDEREHDG